MAARKSPSAAAPLSRILRKAHAYLGVFFAPTFLLFSITGVLQVFSLHEAHGDYQPPAVIVALASLHKDQVLKKAPAHADADDDHAGASADADKDADHGGDDGDHPHHHHHNGKPGLSQSLLKWFVAAAGVVLAGSSLIGLYLALQVRRERFLVSGVLAAGVLIPLVIMFL